MNAPSPTLEEKGRQPFEEIDNSAFTDFASLASINSLQNALSLQNWQ